MENPIDRLKSGEITTQDYLKEITQALALQGYLPHEISRIVEKEQYRIDQIYLTLANQHKES